MHGLVERELAQVDVVFRRGDQVDQLAELGLERDLPTSISRDRRQSTDIMEELEQVDVVALLAEVLLEQEVDG